MILVTGSAVASTSYGTLSNFDVYNDTGEDCHGFEIEIEGIHKTDITYTYDWNHYAHPDSNISTYSTPIITEDNQGTNGSSRVLIRYESGKNPDGSWKSYTAQAVNPLATNGHLCTNAYVNEGCEHFGVGHYGAATVVNYHWLKDDGTAEHNLVRGQAVKVAAPSWTVNNLPLANVPPDEPVQNLVAVIPAPEGEPHIKEYGEPIWVKVIKTGTHNANDIALDDLSSDDKDGIDGADWNNGEPEQTETEWKLLQGSNAGNLKNDELPGADENLNEEDVNVTRRYEFYEYAADNINVNPDLIHIPVAARSSLDGENGEAMCADADPDQVDPISGMPYGIDDNPDEGTEVTNTYGNSYFIHCSERILVGDYIGANMVAFDPIVGIGLIGNLQDGEVNQEYARRVIVGGDTPYSVDITDGTLPPGLQFDLDTGILYGTPTAGGDFSFGIAVTDSQNNTVSTIENYALLIIGGNQPQNNGPVANNQSVSLDEDTALPIVLSGSDQDNDVLSFSIVSGPQHGALSGDVPNLNYTPDANFNGADSLTFKVNDGQADSNVATVNIAVNPVNDTPQANDDTAQTAAGTDVTVNVVGNDSDPDGDALSVISVSAPANGTATIASNTEVLYMPNKRFKSGSDSFTYTISDGNGGTSSATLVVTVGGTTTSNQPPQAMNDSISTPKNTAVTIDILANDSDPDGDTLSITKLGRVRKGSASIDSNKVTFIPSSNYTGSTSFNYTISDGQGGTASAIITVTVQ